MSQKILESPSDRPIADNAMRLLWAGFTAILAAGVGFAIRGGILDNWGREFGFNASQLGVIGGAGFSGFCFGIMIGGVIVDKIGYGKLVAAAFLLHVLSAVVTFSAIDGTNPATAYKLLFLGTFIFAVANGTLEAVANPLVATLFPHNRTHYLNILHASWPAGMVLGGVIGWVLDDYLVIDWKIQLALFMLPTVVYGFMFFGQQFPKSEASSQGLSLADMFKDIGMLGGFVACFMVALFFSDFFTQFLGREKAGLSSAMGYGIGLALLVVVGVVTNFSMGSVLLFVLFIAHALVGAVELGTDGWIQNITGNILSSSEGKILFVFTSMVMFALRFCADFIEKKLGFSPIGILLSCALFACAGLLLTSRAETFVSAILALTIYGIGKTFFWPTMLAVASDRFPRTGAIAISVMGGIGMMSAGLIGSPGLGYFKDRFAGETLQKSSPELFEQYKSEKPSQFLFFPEAFGLDNKKLGEIPKDEVTGKPLSEEGNTVLNASIKGDRRTLVVDAMIPATMAVIYLILMVYFKSIGGYKAVRLDDVGRIKD